VSPIRITGCRIGCERDSSGIEAVYTTQSHTKKFEKRGNFKQMMMMMMMIILT
jgi:hypothetical protein